MSSEDTESREEESPAEDDDDDDYDEGEASEEEGESAEEEEVPTVPVAVVGRVRERESQRHFGQHPTATQPPQLHPEPPGQAPLVGQSPYHIAAIQREFARQQQEAKYHEQQKQQQQYFQHQQFLQQQQELSARKTAKEEKEKKKKKKKRPSGACSHCTWQFAVVCVIVVILCVFLFWKQIAAAGHVAHEFYVYMNAVEPGPYVPTAPVVPPTTPTDPVERPPPTRGKPIGHREDDGPYYDDDDDDDDDEAGAEEDPGRGWFGGWGKTPSQPTHVTDHVWDQRRPMPDKIEYATRERIADFLSPSNEDRITTMLRVLLKSADNNMLLLSHPDIVMEAKMRKNHRKNKRARAGGRRGRRSHGNGDDDDDPSDDTPIAVVMRISRRAPLSLSGEDEDSDRNRAQLDIFDPDAPTSRQPLWMSLIDLEGGQLSEDNTVTGFELWFNPCIIGWSLEATVETVEVDRIGSLFSDQKHYVRERSTYATFIRAIPNPNSDVGYDLDSVGLWLPEPETIQLQSIIFRHTLNRTKTSLA